MCADEFIHANVGRFRGGRERISGGAGVRLTRDEAVGGGQGGDEGLVASGDVEDGTGAGGVEPSVCVW